MTLGKSMLVLVSLLAAGCGGLGDEELGGSVEEEITWASDIEQMLSDNCAGCHSSPPQNGAPSSFRLDKYDQTELGDGINGAFEKRGRIDARAIQQVPSAMPPGGSLTVEQQGILKSWLDAGAPREATGGRGTHAVTTP